SANFVPTGGDFVSGPNRTSPADPFFGRIDLSISSGLPAGQYVFTAHTAQGNISGLRDAAGNPLSANFTLTLNVQPQPVFITMFQELTLNASSQVINFAGPRAFFETPSSTPGVASVAPAPPRQFAIDFSNPLDTTKDYKDTIELIRSADSPTSAPDGDFGTL